MQDSQVTVLSLLGSYQELKDLVESNLDLTPEQLWSVFKNLPQDLHHQDISQIPARKVAQAIVSHPNLAPEQLLFFCAHPMSSLSVKALIHPNFPLSLLNELAQEAITSKKIKTLNKICHNRKLSNKFVESIWNLESLDLINNSNIFRYLSLNSTKVEHFEFLLSIKKTSSFFPERFFLKNPNTPLEILEKISENWWQESLFYKHPNCSQELKEKGLKYLSKNLPNLLEKIKYVINRPEAA